jgi:hypothetical protein
MQTATYGFDITMLDARSGSFCLISVSSDVTVSLASTKIKSSQRYQVFPRNHLVLSSLTYII